jgi:hypothetical protein
MASLLFKLLSSYEAMYHIAFGQPERLLREYLDLFRTDPTGRFLRLISWAAATGGLDTGYLASTSKS